MAEKLFVPITIVPNKASINEALAKTTFTPYSVYNKYGEGVRNAISEYNKTQPKENQYSYLESLPYKDYEQIYNQLPNWLIQNWQKINTSPVWNRKDGNASRVLGWVDTKESPDTANIRITTPNVTPQTLDVAIHELEHTRQSKFGLPKVNGTIETGAKEDKLTNEIITRINTLPEKERNKYFAGNWNKNPKELYANLATEMVKGLREGKAFYDTELGKALGIKKGDPILKFINERTLAGIPSLYEGQGQ